MIPVIVLSSIDRGASTAIAALINALLGIGSIVTNIPSGILATRIGERKSMLAVAAIAVAGLILCLINLGHGAVSLVVFGSGVLLLGAASSVYTLARQSYLTETVPPEMRARALSTLGGVLRIGMFVGPFAGAGAEELWGYLAPTTSAWLPWPGLRPSSIKCLTWKKAIRSGPRRRR